MKEYKNYNILSLNQAFYFLAKPLRLFYHFLSSFTFLFSDLFLFILTSIVLSAMLPSKDPIRTMVGDLLKYWTLLFVNFDYTDTFGQFGHFYRRLYNVNENLQTRIYDAPGDGQPSQPIQPKA